MKMKIAFILCGTGILAQGPAFSLPWYNDFEISAAGGLNWAQVGNTNLVITAFETDSNRVNSVSNQLAWKIGVGYYFLDNWFSPRCYLNHLLFEINLYQVSGTVKGNVWQYQLPQFNNYSFRAPFRSTRLMFDIKPYLFTWERFSPYLILGIGQAWNTLSYQETVIAEDVPEDSALSLRSNTRNQLAEELGVGLSIDLTCWLRLTAEYVYAYLGDGTPATYPTNGIPLSSPPSFSLDNQSLLLGLSLKL
jgi:hypothetical protein